VSLERRVRLKRSGDLSLASCMGPRFRGSCPAYLYLDISSADQPSCPVLGMLDATRGYRPEWGHETNVANDFGKVILKRDGGCSWSPDTGPYHDFQVPCKAHDYCYDLRRSGYTGTVTDSDCDIYFFYLMEAHCNNRVLATLCRDVRDAYYLATVPAVADSDPGWVRIRNGQTSQCADVEGPSTGEFVPLQQWSCLSLSNQRFKILPSPSGPGLFEIRAQHSNKCMWANGGVAQFTCQSYDPLQRYRIQGALNQDQYSIRAESPSFSTCWRVPFNYNLGQNLDSPSCNDYSYWYIWRIQDA
jgi:hypothetical protein